MNNEEISNIQKKANIVDIISSYLPLTLQGKNYFGICPFHEDNHPSMSVSPERQIYKCFSCGASGNVFTFVKNYESVTFLEAVKIVALKSGQNFRGDLKNKKPKLTKEYEIMALALKFYQNNLNTEYGLKAKNYLKERKLDEAIMYDFEIGLALDNNHSLNKFLLNKKYDVESLVNLGLINRSKEYLHDTFVQRIIFPIHNLEGECIAFTARIYEDSDQAKYINSKESKIFKKGQILFNYHRAKSEIKKQKKVLLVEGNMDAIRMYASGFKNVVALMGTSLTSDHVKILKDLRSEIILLFDNDEAGEKATFTNGNILLEAGMTPSVIRLSEEKDPDEYIIRYGPDAFANLLKNPLSFFDFKLNYLKKNKDLTNTTDLVNYVKDIIDNVALINDDLTKEITLKKISAEYNIAYDLLKQELAKKSKVKNIDLKINNTKMKPNKYNELAENILYYMMNDGKYIERFKKELGYFENKLYRNLANEILYYYDNNKEISLADFISFIELNEYLKDDTLKIINNVFINNLSMNQFMDYIKAINKETLKIKIKNLKEKINTELDPNKKMELATELIELKKGCVINE